MILTIPGAGMVEAASANASAEPTSVIEADPFTLNLDWSTVEAQRPAAIATVTGEHQAHAPARPESGLIKIDSVVVDTHLAEIPRTEDGSKQYRVVTQKDQGFSGKFNATKLEEMLNAQARQGWALKSAVTMNIPSHGGHHDELIVILER